MRALCWAQAQFFRALVNSDRAELSMRSLSLSPLSHPLLVDVLSNLYLFLLCKALASLVQIIIPPF